MDIHGTSVDKHDRTASPLIGPILLGAAAILAIVAASILTRFLVDYAPPRPFSMEYQKRMIEGGAVLSVVAIVTGAIGIHRTFGRSVLFCGIASLLTFIAIVAFADKFL